jgi:Ni,Fe-hydrogenase maturation factor
VPPRTSLVRSVRTVTRSGRRVGFVILGELVDESSTLYREFVAELKRRAMPVHTELARETLTAKEFPRYLEQDDRVILVTPFETGTANGQIVIYTQEEFKELASKEQQSRLSQVAYPEVLRWLMVQGIAPEVKIVCLPGKPFASDKAGEAASRIINEGLA